MLFDLTTTNITCFKLTLFVKFCYKKCSKIVKENRQIFQSKIMSKIADRKIFPITGKTLPVCKMILSTPKRRGKKIIY